MRRFAEPISPDHLVPVDVDASSRALFRGLVNDKVGNGIIILIIIIIFIIINMIRFRLWPFGPRQGLDPPPGSHNNLQLLSCLAMLV